MFLLPTRFATVLKIIESSQWLVYSIVSTLSTIIACFREIMCCIISRFAYPIRYGRCVTNLCWWLFILFSYYANKLPNSKMISK